MTPAVDALVARGTQVLTPASDSARTDALLLLARALGRDRAWILAHGEECALPAEVEAFEALCAMRSTGAPLAYVLGSAGFYGRAFAVDARVLVPRPETEHLVDAALKFLGRCSAPAFEVLDVGTGSGAIACTLAAEMRNVRVTATDISPGALAVAGANARALGVAERCTFALGDLLAPVAARRFDVIVANLPYLPTAGIPQPPDSVTFEPRAALDGGPDGLALYRRLLPQASAALKPRALLLLEAAPPVMNRLCALVDAQFPETPVSIGRDYAGHERYVAIQQGSA